MRRILPLLSVFALVFLAVAPAEGGSTKAAACGVASYAYAGVQANSRANGVSATLDTTSAPSVIDGHVGGWIGVGGTDAGPGGAAEWLQTGLAAFAADHTSHMYYEVTVPGASPKYVELDSNVQAGVTHKFAVLEMANQKESWRVWVDGKPVSPPIHLPGSDNKWYPQAVAENWNGGTGACNTYSYRFSDVSLALRSGGVWRPLKSSYVFQDAGYHVVPISNTPRSFLAASLSL
jgi:hypothetical protein